MITLVIIGIIAAITVPAISRSSEKYILRNQFKKTYSTIMNAINKADTDMGGNVLCYYSSLVQVDETRVDCDLFFEVMMKNLNVQKVCKGNAKADGCIPDPWLKKYPERSVPKFYKNEMENTTWVYNLADGTIIALYNWYTTNRLYPLVMVDINGAKGPNEIGKDVFILWFRSDGINGITIENNIFSGFNSPSEQHPYFVNLSDIYKE